MQASDCMTKIQSALFFFRDSKINKPMLYPSLPRKILLLKHPAITAQEVCRRRAIRRQMRKYLPQTTQIPA